MRSRVRMTAEDIAEFVSVEPVHVPRRWKRFMLAQLFYLQQPCVRVFDGASLPYYSSAGNNPGDVVLLGTNTNLVGITNDAITAATTGNVFLEGCYVCPKDASTVTTEGDPIYWNPTGNPTVGTAGTGCMTTTAAGAVFAGTAVQSQLTGDSTVIVKLLGGLTSPGNSTSAFTVNTNITTVGAGTLTAAAIAGKLITRSGSTGAYSDATDTAAAIWAAVPNATASESFQIEIKNTVAFPETITAGMGVTLSGQTVIPPLSAGRFLVTLTSATAATMRGISMSPLTTACPLPIETQGTLTTVGAGTILAALIADGLLLRTGSTAAFTDTTDTGTAIAAAFGDIAIGNTFEWTYQNSTYSVATLTGGTGVASAATFATVGPGCWATFIFTYTAANTFTVTQKCGGDNWIGLPSTSYSTGTTTTTFTAGEMTGGKLTIYTSTAATPGSIATATATAMFAAIQGAYVGLKWTFRVINDVATNSLTVTADTSVTLSGKTTYVATPYGSMDFEMTFTSTTTATMKYIGGGQSTTV